MSPELVPTFLRSRWASWWMFLFFSSFCVFVLIDFSVGSSGVLHAIKWLAPVLLTVSFELPLSFAGSVVGYYSFSNGQTGGNGSGLPRASITRYSRGVHPAFDKTSRRKRFGNEHFFDSLVFCCVSLWGCSIAVWRSR